MSKRKSRSTPDDDSEKLRGFIADLSHDGDVSQDTRRHANSDVRFINVPGGQWESYDGDDDFNNWCHVNDSWNRVKLELDIVSDYVERFKGGWNQNRVGVIFKPDDGETTKEDSDLINGIYRSNFRESSGKISTDNAVKEVATCGYGAMKIATCFEDEGDPENENQNIEWRPIYNAYNTVIWDQSALRVDKRDAGYVTELTQHTKKSFEKEYHGFSAVSAYDPTSLIFSSNNNFQPIDIIYVATRYELVKKRTTFHVYNNLQTNKVQAYSDDKHKLIQDELKKDELIRFVRTRKIVVQTVEKTVFSGSDILEDTRQIAGKWLPIIPFYGHHQYVDGIETYRGLVRKQKDPQRVWNMQMSQVAEVAGSSGQRTPIINPAQIDNKHIRDAWENRTDNPAYLPLKPVMKDGKIIQAGVSGYYEPPGLDPNTATLLDIIPKFVQNTTGGHLQESFSKDMSGTALKTIQKREDLNTQVINDNIANAIEWSGTVYQAMASEVYTTSRLVRTLNKDGAEAQVQLQESVMDEETGQMIEANDLAGKRFKVDADVGPQYETMREQTVETLLTIAEMLKDTPAGEQYLPVVMSMIVQNLPGEGIDPLQEFNRNIMLVQGTAQPQTPEEEAVVQQSQQPKPDPQARLMEAGTKQLTAEATNLESKSAVHEADARKKDAEAKKIESEIGIEAQEAEDKAALEAAKLVQNSQNAIDQGRR